MVQQLLSNLCTLSLFVTGVLKHRVQIVEIIHGSAVTIQALHSDVILHVPDGVYGIILGNIHTDHWRFRHLVPKDDCIIGPICEFFFRGTDALKEEKFILNVPHVLSDARQARNKIKVKHRSQSNGTLSYARPYNRIQNPEDVYYSCTSTHAEIHTPHFCEFFVTAEGINCCSRNAMMLAFSKMEMDDSGPLANVILYFGTVHYRYQDYRQVYISISFHSCF